MRQWQLIAQACEKSRPNLQPFLDLVCYEKDLSVDGSLWNRSEEGIYQNGSYQVNLYTLAVSKLGERGSIVDLPLTVTQNPFFHKVFGTSITDLRAGVQSIGAKKVYSIRDNYGRPVQIEVEGEKIDFYTKFDIEGGKWLQISPKNPFILEKLKKLKEKQENLTNPKKGLRAIFNIFSKIQSFNQEINGISDFFLSYRICMDPANPSLCYCVDQMGEIAFRLKFKENQDGLVIENVIDHRISPKSVRQVNQGGEYQNTALDALSVFETKATYSFGVKKEN